MLDLSNESREMFLISVEYFLGSQVAKDKEEVEARSAKRLADFVNEECQTDLEPGGKSTPDPRKRLRESTKSPEEPATKKKRKNKPEAKKKTGAAETISI